MKKMLKHAVSLQREALAAQKAAAAAEAAGHPERATAFHVNATYQDAAAQALLQPAKLPPVVAGEVVPVEADLPDNQGGWAIRNTLATPDTPALEASLVRTDLLAQSRLDVLALGIDAAAATRCNDPLTKMLAHQAGLAHAAAFKLVDQAMEQGSPAEAARLVNAAGRMMSAFQQALLTLHRLQHGGQQFVTVQHINVTADQAVVTGSLQSGGKRAVPGEAE